MRRDRIVCGRPAGGCSGARVKVDVACVGAPFLDLIFRGLDGLPIPGEERLAQSLVIVPGGMANVAYALRRLELEAVVCGPVGHAPATRRAVDSSA